MRIFLIGFMGCGKTKLGRRLAAETGLQQIDLDHFIEEALFMTVPQIFEKHGEEEFRRIEHEKLKELAQFEDVIISTGGGAPCYYNNMDIMNQAGTTVFLNPKPKKLAKRLLKSKNERPLIKGKNKEELVAFIKMKMKERRPFYNQAKIKMDQEDFTIEQIAEMVTK